ncbi:DUF6471 domain-containing protein [Novosphingopyxis baekryungensis]|uniref:DUF6471 domain-containing protein n=1 Tax=Novosphingopyxis baekryungensis TaxID=279369 RepID=UPI003CCBE747
MTQTGACRTALCYWVRRGIAEHTGNQAEALLKADLSRRGITYAQLVGKLADVGVMNSEPNVRKKISRGEFSTGVFNPMLRGYWGDKPFALIM